MATGNPIKSQMVFCRGFPRYYATWVLFSVVRRFGIYGTVSIFSRWIVFPLHQAFWHGQVLRVRTETETAAPARGQPAAGPRCSGGRVAHVFPLTGSGPPPVPSQPASGEYFGDTSATVKANSVVTLTVRKGTLLATVDGTALPPVEGRLQGSFHFAVSLCAEGQKVAPSRQLLQLFQRGSR